MAAIRGLRTLSGIEGFRTFRISRLCNLVVASSTFPISSFLNPPGSALSADSFARFLGTSLVCQLSISAIVWAIAATTDRAGLRNWLWPSGILLNIWWSVLAPGISAGTAVTTIVQDLGWRERTLLTGVSAWSMMLFYRIASREGATTHAERE